MKIAERTVTATPNSNVYTPLSSDIWRENKDAMEKASVVYLDLRNALCHPDDNVRIRRLRWHTPDVIELIDMNSKEWTAYLNRAEVVVSVDENEEEQLVILTFLNKRSKSFFDLVYSLY